MTRRIPQISVDRLPPTNVIQQLPRTAVPPPVTRQLQQPIIQVPSYQPPSYEPPVVQPALIPEPRGAGGNSTKPLEPDINLPPLRPPETEVAAPIPPQRGTEIGIGGFDIPVPTSKEVTLAGTTAVASVTVALAGKALVEHLLRIFKPIVRITALKIKKKMGRRFNDEEIQLFFAMEQEQKSLTRLLKQDQERQVEEQRLQQHLHKLKHTGSQDETLPHSWPPPHIEEV